jgi:tRNA (adenine22-N1)-methyltransferase
VNEGPLKAAKMNVVESGMSGKIKLVLSNGLEGIEADEADCFVIAGMGGDLICSILDGRKAGMDKFVLQPQRSFEVLRKYLWENGFEIVREAVAKEERRMYCAMYAQYSGEKYTPSESEALCGKRELTEKEPLFKEYMAYRRKIEENALEALEKGGGSGERKRELEKKIEIYKAREK